MFLPQWGWLTPEQQARLSSWYSDVAQLSLPVLIVNSLDTLVSNKESTGPRLACPILLHSPNSLREVQNVPGFSTDLA